MMGEEFRTSWFAFWLLAGPILVGAVHIVFSLYLSRRHLDAMIQALNNSRYIHIWGMRWRDQGWFGRFVLTNKIGGMVLWSKAYIRIGDVDPVDINNFPPHLKRLLQIDAVMLFGCAILVSFGYVLMKLG
jgi:hypothetical protein